MLSMAQSVVRIETRRCPQQLQHSIRKESAFDAMLVAEKVERRKEAYAAARRHDGLDQPSYSPFSSGIDRPPEVELG